MDRDVHRCRVVTCEAAMRWTGNARTACSCRGDGKGRQPARPCPGRRRREFRSGCLWRRHRQGSGAVRIGGRRCPKRWTAVGRQWGPSVVDLMRSLPARPHVQRIPAGLDPGAGRFQENRRTAAAWRWRPVRCARASSRFALCVRRAARRYTWEGSFPDSGRPSWKG